MRVLSPFPPKAEVVSSNLAGSANVPTLPSVFCGHFARLNIVLNTEQIVEKYRRPHKRHLRLGLRRSTLRSECGLSRLPLGCPLWLPRRELPWRDREWARCAESGPSRYADWSTQSTRSGRSRRLGLKPLLTRGFCHSTLPGLGSSGRIHAFTCLVFCLIVLASNEHRPFASYCLTKR